MPSWWGKSAAKNVKKKTRKETFIDTFHRKFRCPSEEKGNVKSGRPQKWSNDTASEMGSQSRAGSRSPSPSTKISCCQSFSDRPLAQPLPLPGGHPASIKCTPSKISVSRPVLEKRGKPLLFLPLPTPDHIPSRTDPRDIDVDMATASVSSNCSIDSDSNSRLPSPQGNESENHSRNVVNSNSSGLHKGQSHLITCKNSRETAKRANISYVNQIPSPSKMGIIGTPKLQILRHGALGSAPDSSMSSPSRSPIRVLFPDQIPSSAFWAAKPYPDVPLLGSGHCSSLGSGQNSGHNSTGGDLSAQIFWQHSRGSPEISPIPSPRMTSPGPSSRIHSGTVSPGHPRVGETTPESPKNWADEGRRKNHRLPLPPPIAISKSSPFSPLNSSATTSLSIPRSPGRADNPTSPGSRWKKGKLIGRGTFGHVYVGFNNESGEMCAMKEVTLFSDDAKSKESAKQLMQEITLLSRLRHPNIVQYYGSETIDDKLYIYLEYVSGGSIHKLLQEYGQFGELAIRSYTQQILSGLAYLHAKNTVHRDIKGANILVDPNGRVKLADFGMAKHITGQSCPLSFKGSPYWMPPEVIRNSNGCNLAVDIWSLGCTVLEMAMAKPPWSQYEGIAAMFKIGNSKELPVIPDHLSNDGKDFVRLCMQRHPSDRPSAAKLLEHRFVKNTAPIENPIITSKPLEFPAGVTNEVRSKGVGHARNLSSLDMEGSVLCQLKGAKSYPMSSDHHMPRTCPVSPIGSLLLNSRSPQCMSGRMSPSPISSPRTTSGSSTPLTGGNGAIPFHHSKQSAYPHESFKSMPRSPNNLYLNGTTYHDPKPDLSRGTQSVSPMFRDMIPSESDILGKSFGGRAVHADSSDLYDGKPVLADHVSASLERQYQAQPNSETYPQISHAQTK
ncbi:Mitogen-activated protein kinase kinase kinase YODA [Acorus calamus]|uniref:mitogen-activated protein kinase kinase kinase n=1 Tax=Acorus calamus TaxID=4465 RepID=A0AAV9C774_ACOCL|nr:Mitogen-activated protein kinase kinase kinase YODA [Acorus calamus]